MFKDCINLTAGFTRQVKDALCNHVDTLNYDNSLFMTMTALLYSRVDNLKISSIIETYANLNEYVYSENPDVYSFCWYQTKDQVPEENEFVKLTKVEEFISNKLNKTVKIRVVPKYNTVCIFTERLTMEIYHFLQSFMPLYFPIFKEKPLTQKEIRLLETLTMKQSSNYLSVLSEISETEEFKNFSLKIMLNGFEKRIFQVKIEKERKIINQLQEEMNRYMNSYRDTCFKIQEADIRMAGLLATENEIESETELQQYLIRNKNLVNIVVNDNSVSFVVATYLIPYLPESWENICRRGAIFKNYNIPVFYDKENVKLLLNAIFSENHTLKMRICAYMKFDYFGSYVESQTNYNYVAANKLLENYVPNPHFDIHNCFGLNKLDILNQIRDGDMIGAIECCINCTKRINIDENMTFMPFIERLLKFPGKCLVSDDGKAMTPVEAVEYLKGLKHETN